MKIKTYSAALISISCLFLYSCGSSNSAKDESIVKKPVKVIKVEAAKSKILERVPGSVQAAQDSLLEAKIAARINKILVKEGQKVKSGETLVELDSHDIRAKLDQALANQKQADSDLKRFAKLLPAGAVTKQEYDGAETRANIAKASVDEAKAMLDFANITAPYDGLITKKLSQEGDLALPGKPLLKMENPELFRFEADIPETLVGGISIKTVLNISLTGIKEILFGNVSEISPTTDQNSRTSHIKIDLPLNKAIRSGQFGYVEIPASENVLIKIPQSAIIERGQLESVFVVEGEKAYLRLVRTGKRNGNLVEVIAGLHTGDLLVVENPSQLIDTDLVEVMQ